MIYQDWEFRNNLILNEIIIYGFHEIIFFEYFNLIK